MISWGFTKAVCPVTASMVSCTLFSTFCAASSAGISWTWNSEVRINITAVPIKNNNTNCWLFKSSTICNNRHKTRYAGNQIFFMDIQKNEYTLVFIFLFVSRQIYLHHNLNHICHTQSTNRTTSRQDNRRSYRNVMTHIMLDISIIQWFFNYLCTHSSKQD